jgi:hypothetical protein
MTDELSNSTLDLLRGLLDGILNDRDAWHDGRVARLLAPGFVRLDRRKVIAQPPADAAGYIASIVELEQITGTFQSYETQEPVGARGERLCALRLIGRFGAFEMDMIVVVQSDVTSERIEQLILYDPEDIDDAVAELDRLYAELGED